MFVFIDESGSTNVKAKQKCFVLSFCLSNNKSFHQVLIDEIRKQCQKEGKPILDPKEVKYHELSRFQQEIAVGILNKRYKNYYLAFVDIEKADLRMTTGEKEDCIQKDIMKLVAQRFKNEIRKEENLTIYVDKKLSVDSMMNMRNYVHEVRGSNKGIKIQWKDSHLLHGLQIADLIAGAFRAKLIKTSRLLEVPKDRVFECFFEGEQLAIKEYKM